MQQNYRGRAEACSCRSTADDLQLSVEDDARISLFATRQPFVNGLMDLLTAFVLGQPLVLLLACESVAKYATVLSRPSNPSSAVRWAVPSFRVGLIVRYPIIPRSSLQRQPYHRSSGQSFTFCTSLSHFWQGLRTRGTVALRLRVEGDLGSAYFFLSFYFLLLYVLCAPLFSRPTVPQRRTFSPSDRGLPRFTYPPLDSQLAAVTPGGTRFISVS